MVGYMSVIGCVNMNFEMRKVKVSCQLLVKVVAQVLVAQEKSE